MDEKNTGTDEFLVCDTLLFKAIFLLVVLVGLLVGCEEVTDNSDTTPTAPKQEPGDSGNSPEAMEQEASAQRTLESDIRTFKGFWAIHSSPAETLHDAIREGDRATAERFLQMGANVDTVEDSGTPLHFAILKGDTEMVRLLLAYGADATASYPAGNRDSNTSKPLHLAVCSGDDEIADLLIAHGSPADVRDAVGSTPLHIAACCGFYHMARLLIACGADVNAECDYLDYTPLDMAQRTYLHNPLGDLYPVCRAVGNRSAARGAVAVGGRLLLVRSDREEVAKLLLSHGAVSVWEK